MNRGLSVRGALLGSVALLPIFAAVAFAQQASEEELLPPDAPASEQAGGPGDGTIVLDKITVVPTKTAEPVATSLAAVSQVDSIDLRRIQATQTNEIFFGVPGVTAQSDSRRAQTSFNIRGLQDFGRVAVIVDGARNNFQRSDHGTQSVVFLEPELLKEATVVRGPVSNIYGSGAIGGVIVFETIGAFDFLRPEERAAGALTVRGESNGPGFTTSATAAARIADAFGILGNLTYKDLGDYTAGNGDEIDGTGAELLGGLLKATLRPDENQELNLGWIGKHDEWTERFGTPRDTELDQNTFTGKYEYADPDNPWVDFHVSGYLNDVDQAQTQLVAAPRQFDPVTGAIITVPAGSQRSFSLTTTGFDIWNTSRFENADGAIRNALTYGGDWMHDDVNTADDFGGASVYTPSGERTAYGAFVQNRFEAYDWLEVIGALRFDGYELEGTVNGADVGTDGTKLSPRLTIGISPFEQTEFRGIQLYGTYAEGYRSPAVTETLISGLHPSGVAFPFLPNPDLRPETATTYEIGANFSRNDLFIDGDGLRVKTAVFRNNIEDYIEGVNLLPSVFPGGDPACIFVPAPGRIPACFQYRNIDRARIEGFEFESTYDAGRFFTGFNVTLLDGENLDTGERLASVPPAVVTGRLGARFLDYRLVVGGEAQHVFDDDDITAPYTDDYTLVNLFASYEVSESFRLDFRVNNLFDVTYQNYLNSASGAATFEPGINVKLGGTIRFGVPDIARTKAAL